MVSQNLSLRSKIVLTLAVFVGSGTIYYSQPLLARMAAAFQVSQLQAGTISTATLAGFVTGLLLVVPLADVLEKRRMILVLLWLVSAIFAALALCESFSLFVVLSFLLGLSSMVSQTVIPYVARMSAPAERGRNLGIVLSGALTGVLVARAASGIVAEHLGFRAVFWLGCTLMLLLSAVLAKVLPEDKAVERIPYPALLYSVWRLFVDLRELRNIAFTGAFMYAAMTGFWATLAFRLESPLFHMGPEATGMFGFVGAAGALAASLAGPLADRVRPRTIVYGCIAMMMAAYALLHVVGSTLAGLVLGVVLLDFGAQAATVSNQTALYRLSDTAQSRLNTVYKVVYNGGGAVGSITAVYAWSQWGWAGVCANGFVLLVFAAIWSAFTGVGIGRGRPIGVRAAENPFDSMRRFLAR